MAAHECEKWMLRESAKGGLYCAACGKDQPSKHLSDAECAAEYWRSTSEYLANHPRDQKEWYIGAIWHRFATHPHAT